MPGAVDYSALLTSFDSATFRELRPAQAAVLEAYAADFAHLADVGVELPTGAGKSLIALLVAEAWRQAGRTASILTANKALAAQMESHGRELGITTARLEGSAIPGARVRPISRGQAVGVMNYWVYFNQNPALDPTDLVVLDDVHLADGALQSLFSVAITRRDHPVLFARLADALVDALPGYPSVRDAADGASDPFSPTDLIAPHDHHAVIGTVTDIIDAAERPSDLDFRWSRLRARADQLHLYVKGDELVLRPYVWPLQELDHYRQATQRIYLSATLGSAADLQRRLGCAPVNLIPVADDNADPLGRRLIILDGHAEQERAHAAVDAAVDMHGKGLWLTPSHQIADTTAQMLRAADREPVWRLSRGGEETEMLAHAARGHLVAAGRYDGIDLPDNACRLVVVTHLPRAVDLQETFLSEQLRDASFLLERVNARVLQPLVARTGPRTISPSTCSWTRASPRTSRATPTGPRCRRASTPSWT